MNKKNGWMMCTMCNQMLHGGGHRCPAEALAKKDAELDMVIDVELSTWDNDVKRFWKSNDVKFYTWLAEKERE